VEPNSPAFENGLRAGNLITHINGEVVEGMVHVQVVALITQSGDNVAISATPLDSTTIQSGGPKREPSLGKMVRQRSKHKLHRENISGSNANASSSGGSGGSSGGKLEAKKRMSLFRRISSKWAEQHLGSPSSALMKPFSWVGRSFSFSSHQPKLTVSKGTGVYCFCNLLLNNASWQKALDIYLNYL
jgi:microtubule-associated serine/threonine kinase